MSLQACNNSESTSTSIVNQVSQKNTNSRSGTLHSTNTGQQQAQPVYQQHNKQPQQTHQHQGATIQEFLINSPVDRNNGNSLISSISASSLMPPPRFLPNNNNITTNYNTKRTKNRDFRLSYPKMYCFVLKKPGYLYP